MLDYLISLGNQDSAQDAEEESVSTEDKFDFDNAYAEYLKKDDDSCDDNVDDEDEEDYFGLSMWITRLALRFAVCRPVCDLLRKAG